MEEIRVRIVCVEEAYLAARYPHARVHGLDLLLEDPVALRHGGVAAGDVGVGPDGDRDVRVALVDAGQDGGGEGPELAELLVAAVAALWVGQVEVPVLMRHGRRRGKEGEFRFKSF